MQQAHDAVAGVLGREGGIRTPKLRTSTSTGSVTMLSTKRRGMMTRGLEQDLPVESSVCSHKRHVAPGTPSRLKKISGSLVWMAMRSYMGSRPYSVMPSTRTNQPSSPSSSASLPLAGWMPGWHTAISSVTGWMVQVSLMLI